MWLEWRKGDNGKLGNTNKKDKHRISSRNPTTDYSCFFCTSYTFITQKQPSKRKPSAKQNCCESSWDRLRIHPKIILSVQHRNQSTHAEIPLYICEGICVYMQEKEEKQQFFVRFMFVKYCIHRSKMHWCIHCDMYTSKEHTHKSNQYGCLA